jgi:hypothetical protein
MQSDLKNARLRIRYLQEKGRLGCLQYFLSNNLFRLETNHRKPIMHDMNFGIERGKQKKASRA